MTASTAAKHDLNKQWMVRKAQDTVALMGPFWTDQVRTMVEQGLLGPDDEICPENGYWFALREPGEVKKLLGIDYAPPLGASDEEPTQPDLLTDLREATGLVKMAQSAKTPATAPISALEIKTRFRRVSRSRYLGYGGQASSPQLLGIEKSRLWGFAFAVAIVMAGLGVLWVLKSLKI